MTTGAARELRNLRTGATWSMPLTSLTGLNWEEEGSGCTRRAEVEGLVQGQGLAAQGGAETHAPGPAPDHDPDPGPGPSRVTVPGPGPGPGPGLTAGPEAEADHEMLKESKKQTL